MYYKDVQVPMHFDLVFKVGMIFVFILELPTIQPLRGCELTGVFTMLSA